MSELTDPPLSEDSYFQNILPPRKHVKFIVGWLIACGASVITWGFAFFIGIDYLVMGSLWDRRNLIPSIICASFGAIMILVALRTWSLRNEPLVVSWNGRVWYRNKELIAAGTAREIVVRRKVDESEGGSAVSYHVIVQRTDHCEVDLPPYFSAFADLSDAQTFGSLLADALRISIRG
jgi:hypothetical protein